MTESWIHKANPKLVAVLSGLFCMGLSFSFPLLGSFGILLSYFSTAPLFFSGLGWGLHAAILSAVTTVGGIALLRGVEDILLFLGTHILPVLFVLSLLLRHKKRPDGKISWYPMGYVVSWIVGIVILAFLFIAGYVWNDISNPVQALQTWFASATTKAPQLQQDVDRVVLEVLPGLVGLTWVLMLFSNMWVAHKILLKSGKQLRPYPVPQDRRLPEFWDIIFIACILLNFSDHLMVDFVAENIALVACIPLFILGLSVFQAWTQRFGNAHLWLVSILVLTFLLVWPGVFIVLLGLFEPLLQLRRRARQSKII